MEKWLFLAGAWLCAFGFVPAGLLAFCAGGLPGVLKGDTFSALFMLANIAGLMRFFMR